MSLDVYWNQPVCPSVCVQNISVYQSAGRDIQSHLVTALVSFRQRKSDPMPFNKEKICMYPSLLSFIQPFSTSTHLYIAF